MEQGKDIRRFLIQNRGAGTTKVLTEVANQLDCYVLVVNLKDEREIKGAISILKLPEAGMALKKAPVFLDNNTVLDLIDKYEAELQRLRDEKIKGFKMCEDSENKVRKELYDYKRKVKDRMAVAKMSEEQLEHYKREYKIRGIAMIILLAALILSSLF